MNLFATLNKYLRLSGILPWDSTFRGRIISLIINFAFFGNYFILFLSTLWFFLFEAVTFSEFSECFYFLNCSLLLISWYLIYLLKREEFVALFAKLTEIIEERK